MAQFIYLPPKGRPRSGQPVNYPKSRFKSDSEYNVFRMRVRILAVEIAERELFISKGGKARTCINCDRSECEVTFVIAHEHGNACKCEDPKCIISRNSNRASGNNYLSFESLMFGTPCFCEECNAPSQMGTKTAKEFLSPERYVNWLAVRDVKITKEHFDKAEHMAFAETVEKRTLQQSLRRRAAKPPKYNLGA